MGYVLFLTSKPPTNVNIFDILTSLYRPMTAYFVDCTTYITIYPRLKEDDGLQFSLKEVKHQLLCPRLERGDKYIYIYIYIYIYTRIIK